MNACCRCRPARRRDCTGRRYRYPGVERRGDTGRGLDLRGQYDTLEALMAAVTSPSVGDAYSIGPSEPYEIYIYGEQEGANRWINNGKLQGAQGPGGPKRGAGPPRPPGAPGPGGRDRPRRTGRARRADKRRQPPDADRRGGAYSQTGGRRADYQRGRGRSPYRGGIY